MVRRRYTLLARYAVRLTNELKRILRSRGSKREKMMRAKEALDNHFDLLIPYVFRTRVIRDIGTQAVMLTAKDLLELEKVKANSLEIFSEILEDLS